MAMVVGQGLIVDPGVAIKGDDRVPQFMGSTFLLDPGRLTCVSDALDYLLYGMKRWRFYTDTGFIGDAIYQKGFAFVCSL